MSGSPGFVQGAPDFDKLEIVVIGYTDVSTNGSVVNWVTVPHNLGYKPLIMAYFNNVTVTSGATTIFSHGDIPLPSWYNLAVDTGGTPAIRFTTYINYAIDSTNAYFLLFNSLGTTFSVPIKYYLLRERTN
jgi:hypothetical protein